MDKLIINKIKVLLLCVSCFFLSLKMQGQSIGIKSIKPENLASAKFYFELANYSDTVKLCSVSLEKQEADNNWYEIKSDVFNTTPTKKTRIFSVTGNGTAKHFFYPSKIIGSTYKDHKYRLKVRYGNDFNDKNQILYSDTFIFK